MPRTKNSGKALKDKPEFFYLKTDKEDYPPKLSNIRF